MVLEAQQRELVRVLHKLCQQVTESTASVSALQLERQLLEQELADLDREE
jgi:hypothetical protein